MSTYVIGDIHGCYDKLQDMIYNVIRFSDSDTLYMVGDYIDRGDQSVEVMQWLENLPDNIYPVLGNHDADFAYYVYLMKWTDAISNKNTTDPDSNKDAIKLYFETQNCLRKIDQTSVDYFDMYETIINILSEDKVTMSDLDRWAKMFKSFPLFREVVVNDRRCIIVHAGYKEGIEDEDERSSFFLKERDRAYTEGGIKDGMVIAGHTPTLVEGQFVFNNGNVFRYYDRKNNCIFYDIDCGCVFQKWDSRSKLACIRLEDEKIFYV